jgi:hypothetical protein
VFTYSMEEVPRRKNSQPQSAFFSPFWKRDCAVFVGVGVCLPHFRFT